MKLFRLLIISMILIYGCKKSSNNSTPEGTFSYSLTFDSVINCYANTSYDYVFNIDVLTGNINTNPLTCSVASLPASVSISPVSQVVTSNLGGIFVFTIGNVNPGYDTMSFVLSGAAGSQKHDLILHVLAQPAYASILAGSYDSSFDFCSPTTYYYASVVAAITDTPSKITISNIRNLGSSFVVSASLTPGSVTIPIQSVSGYTIWGSGTFALDSRPAYDTEYSLVISDTLVNAGDTTTCTCHIRH